MAFGNKPSRSVRTASTSSAHLLEVRELRTVFPSLFRRFPEVRLAGDVSTLRIRNDRTGGGIDDVPLTW